MTYSWESGTMTRTQEDLPEDPSGSDTTVKCPGCGDWVVNTGISLLYHVMWVNKEAHQGEFREALGEPFPQPLTQP